MPALFTTKDYFKDGYYHLFNRGVDKRKIFVDDHDYKVFLYLLKRYLSKPDAIDRVQPSVGLNPLVTKSLHDKVDLLAFCLMPNHYHLLLKQLTRDGFTKLLHRVCTNYVMHFNKKHKRRGGLFEGVFKGILINNEDGIINVANYIHLNPLELLPEKLSDEETLKKLSKYPYSSLGNYLGERKTSWVKTEEILKMVNGKNNYRKLLHKPLDLPVSFEDYLASLKGETLNRVEPSAG